jgi:Family of unknown function (DUF5675)
MAEETIPKFYFYRTNETVKHNGVIGNRGILEAGGNLYFTIERDIIKHVNIEFGTYPLSMEISPSHAPRRQFRIENHNVYNNSGVYAALLIHVGNYPDDLTGCIGPGKSKLTDGVNQSGEAMEELFKFCGGFQVKKNAAILEVVPQFAYDLKKLKGTFIGDLSLNF